ncbi:MAG: hypothetical protein Q7K45_03455 [Nanoarchaeota archaeon]|nr:hypothetical protein [Nanoarchaeota archaeon]
MKFIRTIALAGFLSLFPTEMTYAKPTSLEEELKELAELAMKCGEKTSFDKIIYPENFFVPIGPVEYYSFTVPLNPQPPSTLPFPATVHFRFQEGSYNTRNHAVDKGDSFEIISRDAGYFKCFYQHKGDFAGRGCGPDRFIYDGLLEVQIRKAVEFIKKNIPAECYGNIV